MTKNDTDELHPASSLADQREAPIDKIVKITDELEKPLRDDRQYRVVRLPNNLEVLLVHDAETDKASAAMDVNVGNFSDPEELPGLSHSLEHMLFMGTKKYPVENEYSQYLSANSGSSNAYTAATSTNYYFEVAAKPADNAAEGTQSPLYGALDRFAQFFIEPLFLTSTLDRELRAVDSEHKKNLQSDQWRLHQLDKALANPKHPYCHFSTGSLETLKVEPEKRGTDVRQAFIDHHERYYSANVMKLVILGREPLDTLEQWAGELFSGIANKNLKQNRWETETPYRPDDLCTQIFAKPVMDSKSVEITFPYLDEELLFESSPSNYLSHLIGHEGPGSIMSYIKNKGWANGLSAGAYAVCPGSLGFFNVDIKLTEEGLKNYKEVVKALFQYISMLNDSAPQQWIFEEIKNRAEIEFKYKQKSPASRFTSRTSAVMQLPLPRQWLLSGDTKLRKFEPELIKKGLSYLRPDNFRLQVVSQTFPGDWDKKEKYYGTEYKLEKVPEDFMSEIKSAFASTTADRLPELHLPHKNMFIPENLDVEKKDVEKPAIAPTLIRNDEHVQAWFKKDDTFWVPKANIYIVLRNPLPGVTAENAAKARLYAELVKDALEEYAYDAELSGLVYGVSNFSGGLEIEISGYNDKISVLLEKVLLTMRDLEIKEDRFQIVKERLIRFYKNWDLQQPYVQVGDYTTYLNSERGFIKDDTLAEMANVTAGDVAAFYPQLLRQAHIQSFAHGNLYKEDALKLTSLVENTFHPRALPKVQWPVTRCLIFPPGCNFRYNRTLPDPANVNHAIEYFLYFGDKSDRVLRAKSLLLDQITHEPAFDQLRTKEQLGYVVFSGARVAATTIGYRFIVQSERNPEYLESRIDAFLTGYRATLAAMSETEFEGHKRSLITKRLEKLKNLGQESGRLWQHIVSEYLDFEINNLDAEHIRALTKPQLLEFFDTYVLPSSPSRAKLAVHLLAKGVSKPSSEAATPTPTTTAAAPLAGAAPSVADKVASAALVAADTITKTLVGGMENMTLNGEKAEVKDGSGKKVTVIGDVRAFKAGLAVTPGPRAVRELCEFEEGGAKL